jgi:GT2 family glycosyltransferase
MNAGVMAAGADILVFTDDDARPHDDWIQRLVTAYADPSVGAVGGRDVIYQHGGVEEGFANVVGRVRWYGRVDGNHHLGTGAPREVDVLKGVNLSLRRALWAVDSRLRGTGAEPHWELELTLKIGWLGWRVVYDPEAVVDHFVAPRMQERQRDDVSPAYVCASAHNETYALLKWSPLIRVPIVLAYGILVGSRMAPGVAAAARRLRRGDGRGRVFVDLRAALAGRLLAVGSFASAVGERRAFAAGRAYAHPPT